VEEFNVLNRTARIVAGLSAVFAFILVVACTEKPQAPVDTSNAKIIQMEVFKQASCGCCGKWIDHIEGAGFEVKARNRQNLNAIKKEFGIQPRYQSCHTGVVDGYIFEGHIPASLVERFLEEKPGDAIGLAVPGMPVGSPGMEMEERFDSYDVLLLKSDGSSEVYAHIDGPGWTDQASSAPPQ
tara:strand:+ start:1817 stop:2365 length:549 start_codon:yes stop_codon:yes gene_type:complete